MSRVICYPPDYCLRLYNQNERQQNDEDTATRCRTDPQRTATFRLFMADMNAATVDMLPFWVEPQLLPVPCVTSTHTDALRLTCVIGGIVAPFWGTNLASRAESI